MSKIFMFITHAVIVLWTVEMFRLWLIATDVPNEGLHVVTCLVLWGIGTGIVAVIGTALSKATKKKQVA